MSLKTLTFWPIGMSAKYRRIFDNIRKQLGAAQREMVKAWLRLALAEDAYGIDPGKRAGREVFGDNEYSNDLLNNLAYADVHENFKQQWKRVRSGNATSVSFSDAAANVLFLMPPSGGHHATVEHIDGNWWITRLKVFGGCTKADRERNDQFRWQLKGVSRFGGKYEKDLMDGAQRICQVRVTPSRKDPSKYVVQVTVEVPDLQTVGARTPVCAGIDLGINCPVVLSIPDKGFVQFMGRERDEYPRLWEKLREYEDRKRRLNRAGKRRAARDLRPRITNVRKYINEAISKDVADTCRALGVTHLRMEDLKGLSRHKSMTGKLRYWPRYHLQERIERKCCEVGIEVERIKPAGTSQTCSVCGHREKANRNGAQFVCIECGYQQHADLNAANNIARGMQTFGPCAKSSASDDAIGLRFDSEGQESALGQAKRLFA